MGNKPYRINRVIGQELLRYLSKHLPAAIDAEKFDQIARDEILSFVPKSSKCTINSIFDSLVMWHLCEFHIWWRWTFLSNIPSDLCKELFTKRQQCMSMLIPYVKLSYYSVFTL